MRLKQIFNFESFQQTPLIDVLKLNTNIVNIQNLQH